MNKEFHLYEKINDMPLNEIEFNHAGYYDTGRAIHDNHRKINSDQICFFNTKTLVEKGYRLFIHFANGKIEEVKIGNNTCTNREIKESHNLPKMLLSGEFGELSFNV